MALRFSMMLLLPCAAGLSFQAARSLRPRYMSPKMAVTIDETSEPLAFVTLENANGDSAKVYLFGACVTSYIKGGRESLMVRPDAKMDGSKPISGGIPFCFPQFGPGAMQQHGFARNCIWSIDGLELGDSPSIVFKLSDDEYTRGMWDYPFECLYKVTLGTDALNTEFKVLNKGDAAFDFTAALHTYWSVSSIDNLKIEGPFEGSSFLDKMQDPPAKSVADSSVLEISKETDSVYEGVNGDVMLKDSEKGTLTIRSSGWKDTVVWNPYGNEGMGYNSFVCVECAKALEPITVAPSEEWLGTMDVIPASPMN